MNYLNDYALINGSLPLTLLVAGLSMALGAGLGCLLAVIFEKLLTRKK